jgi:predicted secreted acid phosphatase
MDLYPIYPTITSFREVDLGNGTSRPLVLCDIDETVMHHKYSFQSVHDMVQKDYADDPDATTDFILAVSKQYYLLYQRSSKPIHTDLEGFNDLLAHIEEKGGELQFLTARGPAFDTHTREQLKSIGIEEHKFKIHYCGGVAPSKGDYIENFMDISEKENVLFIDDYDHFIMSVLSKHPKIRCYKFHIAKERDTLVDIFSLCEGI